MAKKVFIKTFGCQMNEYDSDKMADVMRAAEGYEPTTDVDEADLILFNTCSVREKAQEKVFSDLGRVQHLKKKGVLIGVGGCVASQEGAEIIKRAPYVDVVFGPQTLHRLPELLESAGAAGPRRWTSASPRSRSSTTCRPRASKGCQRLRLASWKAAASTAATAWCPTRAARKFQPPVRRRAGRDCRPGRPGA
jgi:tRNA A37 methylthiotransferase MiaB